MRIDEFRIILFSLSLRYLACCHVPHWNCSFHPSHSLCRDLLPPQSRLSMRSKALPACDVRVFLRTHFLETVHKIKKRPIRSRKWLNNSEGTRNGSLFNTSGFARAVMMELSPRAWQRYVISYRLSYLYWLKTFYSVKKYNETGLNTLLGHDPPSTFGRPPTPFLLNSEEGVDVPH